jgi:hypothetical protein
MTKLIVAFRNFANAPKYTLKYGTENFLTAFKITTSSLKTTCYLKGIIRLQKNTRRLDCWHHVQDYSTSFLAQQKFTNSTAHISVNTQLVPFNTKCLLSKETFNTLHRWTWIQPSKKKYNEWFCSPHHTSRSRSGLYRYCRLLYVI